MTAGCSTTLRNGRLTALSTAAGNAAVLSFYSGTRPATGASLGAATLLVSFTCGTPFHASITNGVMTLTAVGSETAVAGAAVTGTPATWARLVTSGATHVADFDVTNTGGGGDLTMDNTSIISGATISPGTITITDGNP